MALWLLRIKNGQFKHMMYQQRKKYNMEEIRNKSQFVERQNSFCQYLLFLFQVQYPNCMFVRECIAIAFSLHGCIIDYPHNIIIMLHKQDSRQQIEAIPYQSLVAAGQIDSQLCLICMSIKELHSLIAFGQCGHKFCRDCLSQHLSFTLKRFDIPKCPQQQCEWQLSLSSQVCQILDENQRQRFKKVVSYLSIIKNNNYLPCQKEDCIGYVDKTQENSECNLCKEKHCPICYQLYHDGQCRARIAMELQTREKFRQCKKCGQIIEKIEGCTHMQCPCGHYFCYSCGESLDHREHKCLAPAHFNFFQSIRWSVQHEQLWYQFNEVNFLRYLVLVSPPRSFDTALQVLWSFGYLFIIYPVSMILIIALSVLAFLIICGLFLLFTLAIPFFSLFSDTLELWPSSAIQELFGTLPALIVILCMYPILYFINFVQVVIDIFREEDFTFENVCILPIHLLKGIRNMALMPCLMLIDNEKYYLAEGQLRRFDLLRNQYIREIHS